MSEAFENPWHSGGSSCHWCHVPCAHRPPPRVPQPAPNSLNCILVRGLLLGCSNLPTGTHRVDWRMWHQLPPPSLCDGPYPGAHRLGQRCSPSLTLASIISRHGYPFWSLPCRSVSPVLVADPLTYFLRGLCSIPPEMSPLPPDIRHTETLQENASGENPTETHISKCSLFKAS